MRLLPTDLLACSVQPGIGHARLGSAMYPQRRSTSCSNSIHFARGDRKECTHIEGYMPSMEASWSQETEHCRSLDVVPEPTPRRMDMAVLDQRCMTAFLGSKNSGGDWSCV